MAFLHRQRHGFPLRGGHVCLLRAQVQQRPEPVQDQKRLLGLAELPEAWNLGYNGILYIYIHVYIYYVCCMLSIIDHIYIGKKRIIYIYNIYSVYNITHVAYISYHI